MSQTMLIGDILGRFIIRGLVLSVSVCGCMPASPTGTNSTVPTESVLGNVQSVTITRTGEFDLAVIGNDSVVEITSGTVRNLMATGNGHRITFSSGTTAQFINVSGNDIKVHIPKNVEPASVTITGNNCEVIKD